MNVTWLRLENFKRFTDLTIELHPHNIAEVSPAGFDETEYRRLVQERMAAVRDRLLMNLERSRNSYEVIRTLTQETKRRAMQEIADATASDDFETFYPFLDMKHHRPGDYLEPFNLQRLDLARTAWMRNTIAAVFTPLDRRQNRDGPEGATALSGGFR